MSILFFFIAFKLSNLPFNENGHYFDGVSLRYQHHILPYVFEGILFLIMTYLSFLLVKILKKKKSD